MDIKKITVQIDENSSKKPRIYFFHSKESILDNLVNRHDRPYKLYREFLPEIFKKADIPANTKARWSQYAGCSCPCSPGFIVEVDKRVPAFWGMEIYVDLN